jgi:enhancing lycopene biosynthesis protein 2
MKNMPKFAVVLSGCGRADGSEINESVTALLAIDQAGCTYQCFAPDIEQAVVVNTLTNEKMPERRNVLVESARIARGNIKPLGEFDPQEFDCIVFPGGLGAVLNWCDFAQKGVNCTVESSVAAVMEKAYRQKLVIGAMCIAPVVVAKVLGKYGVTVTIGSDKTTAETIAKTGAKHEVKSATEACVDAEHRVVTTPAYMMAKSIKEVYAGAQAMIAAMVNLVVDKNTK